MIKSWRSDNQDQNNKISDKDIKKEKTKRKRDKFLMNPIKKSVLKALSYPYINLKKYYRSYRKFLTAVNVYFKPKYNLMDHKVVVDGREIQVRVFLTKKIEEQRPDKTEVQSPDKIEGHKSDKDKSEEKKPNKVLIFFHGGGWVTGNIDSYTAVCSKMAKQTVHTVISVDYRLAPEYPFPAGLEDCYHVTRDIILHPDILGCKESDITLIGDSAGANLAAAVSLMARNRGEFLPVRQILIYPATYYDHSDDSPFDSIRENGSNYILTSKRIQDYWDLYISNEEDKYNPYAAPLLAENLSNQPKTLIITAEYDPLRDEGEAYGKRLREYNNDVRIHRMKGALHGFISSPWGAESTNKCYQIINDFLDEGSVEMSD